jgi:hypothetical protein
MGQRVSMVNDCGDPVQCPTGVPIPALARDVDAMTLSMANLVYAGLHPTVGSTTIILGVVSNIATVLLTRTGLSS